MKAFAALIVLIVIGCYMRNGAPVLTWRDFGLCVIAIGITAAAMLIVFPVLTLLFRAFVAIGEDAERREEDAPHTSVRVIRKDE